MIRAPLFCDGGAIGGGIGPCPCGFTKSVRYVVPVGNGKRDSLCSAGIKSTYAIIGA